MRKKYLIFVLTFFLLMLTACDLVKKERPIKLATITFGDTSYGYENVIRAVGSLTVVEEILKNNYNIDINNEIFIVEDKIAYQLIYNELTFSLDETSDSDDDSLEGFVWLFVSRQAPSSSYISIEYFYQKNANNDYVITFVNPHKDEPGDAAMFSCLDVVKISFEYYEKVVDLTPVELDNFAQNNDNEVYFQLRPYYPYLDYNQESLLINSEQELQDYIGTLNKPTTSLNYLNYLGNLSRRDFFANHCLLLLKVSASPDSTEMRIRSIETKNGILEINLNAIDSQDFQMVKRNFVLEIDRPRATINAIVVNVNYLTEPEKFYLNAYAYNFSHFDKASLTNLTVTTYEELEDYIAAVVASEDCGLDGYYINQLLHYNEDYFLNNKLVIINFGSSSISYRYLYDSYKVTDGKLTIYFSSNNPASGLDVIAPWNFVIEVTNLLEFNEVEVRFDR